MLQDVDFYHLLDNMKIIWHGLNASKKVLHKAGEYLGKKLLMQ